MSAGKVIAITGAIAGGATALGLIMWKIIGGFPDRPMKDIHPDVSPPPPGRTGYNKIDAFFDKLRAVAQETGIPLGLMVGWIAKESGGRLNDTTSLDERGLFQLMPSESKSLGLDHERLSTDLDYSIAAGPKIIKKYQSNVNDLDLIYAPAGNSYYWRLVKLAHSMGAGQMKKVVKAAMAAGHASTWDDLETFALDMKINGPQPKKWFPFVDLVYKVGRPFGFGSESTVAVAGLVMTGGLDYLGVEEVA
jgi:hypothetical protein